MQQGKQKYLPCQVQRKKAVRIMYDLETPIREDFVRLIL